MEHTDLHETADDRQLFIAFPSEVDELLSMAEYPHFNSRELSFFILFYLTERRQGISHDKAMDNSSIEVRKLKSGVYGNEHPRN